MTITKKIFFLVLIYFQLLLVNSQNSIDFFKKIKFNTKEPKKALILINKELSKDTIDGFYKALLLEYKADILKQEKNIYTAIDLYKKSYSVFVNINNDTLQIKLLNKISDLYIETEDYSNAITNLNKVDELLGNMNIRKDHISSRYLANMAQMYFKAGQIKKARIYFLQSFISAKNNNKNLLLNQHYLDYSNFNISINKLDSALFYANKILEYNSINENKKLKANTLLVKGMIYEKLDDFILAETQYKKAIKVLNKSKRNTAQVYKKLGDFYTRVYLYNYAYVNFKKAENKINKKNNDIELQNLYHNLAKNSILRKKSNKALYYLAKYDSVQLIREKTIEKKNIEYINERYNIQQEQINYLNDRNTLLKKQRELINQKELAKKNRLIWLSIILGLILISFFYYNYLKLKSEKSNLQLKNTVLRLQMNPHFIFNSLTAIQNSILKNDQLKSAELIAVFSKLIRQNLDFSDKKSISLYDEIDMLTNYLETQQFRFNDLFEFKIEVDPEIITEDVQIPPMLLQPFVENSIEHGLKHIEKNGKLYVKFVAVENGIKISIEDNGVGLKSAEKNNKNHDDKDKIHAIKIFKERLKIRQKKELKGFKISDVLNKKKNVVGTRVEFILID